MSPGDVVFVWPRTLSASLNVWAQRKFGRDRQVGSNEWFSHVAIVLDSHVAFEAAPATEKKQTWSGVDSVVTTEGGRKLNQGARLTLLPDLLCDVPRRAVLRHPRAENLPPAEFDYQSRHIATMYGSEYSLIRLQASFEERFSRLAEWVPAKLTTWILNYASAPPDEFGEILRADSSFRLAMERELPSLELASTYFCSELVVAMLVHVGLLHEEASVARLTPSSLYDRLLNDGWQDATPGYAALLNRWQESDRAEWENRYLSAVGFAAVARQQHLTAAAVCATERQYSGFNESLEGIIDRLSLLWANSKVVNE